MDNSVMALTISAGSLLTLVGGVLGVLRFMRSWQNQISAEAAKKATTDSRISALEKDTDALHDKIRSLESLRAEDHELMVEMRESLKYIRESIDELKKRGN
jgi:predicted  nucleic acid-binding Zn-ribbon protein